MGVAVSTIPGPEAQPDRVAVPSSSLAHAPPWVVERVPPPPDAEVDAPPPPIWWWQLDYAPQPVLADSRTLHADLVLATRRAARIDRAIGRALQRLRALDGVPALGYARFGDFVRERLGQSPSWAEECVRLERVCATHPDVASAHASGRLTTSHVLAIASIVDEANAPAWVACARDHTVRELRPLVAAARRTGRSAPEGYEHLVSTWNDAGVPLPARAHGAADSGAEEERRFVLQFSVPAVVASLFDHAVDVARRLSGQQIPVHACIDHMLGEYAAGHEVEVDVAIDPEDIVAWELGPDPTREHLGAIHLYDEISAERSSDRWRNVRVAPHADEIERVVDAHPPPDPVALDAHIQRLLMQRRARHGGLAELLCSFNCKRGWFAVGYASMSQYCREALGISARLAQELRRVHRLLWDLPRLQRAHETGEISWAKLRLLVDICTHENEHAWLTRARRVTYRYLEREVHIAKHRRDADPGGWCEDPGPRPLAFVPPYAERSPVRPGVDLWLGEGAVAHTSAHDAGDADPHTSARDAGDADAHTSARDAGDANAHTSARGSVECPCRIRVWLPESVLRRWFDVDVAIARRLGGSSARWERLVVLLGVFLEQWDTAAYETWSTGAEVHRAFGWMCAAPGCSVRRGLEGHHVEYRSHGGSDDACNLVSLCPAHHRVMLHGGSSLRVSGRAPDDLEWTLPFSRALGDVYVYLDEPSRCRRAIP